MPKITQQELATRLGVSRSTVAAALNPGSPIKLNEATRQRILKAAEQHHYRPDRYARVMRGGRSGLIGVLHFGGLLQVAAERATHAAQAVRREGYEVVAADLSWSTESLQTACASMLDARVEGVILSGLNLPASSQELRRLQTAGTPVVALSGNPLPWAPHFRADTRNAIARLTTHLLDLGHRRLALMTHITERKDEPGSYIWAGRERALGFEAALREAGGSLGPTFRRSMRPQGIITRVGLPRSPFDPFGPGIEGMRALLRQSPRPTALLCSNDEVAYGALSVCQEAGLSVPGELSLTGYDDTTLGRYCAVPLTTARQPNEAMAEAAVEALVAAIQHGTPPRPAKPRLFPCEILLRRSTAPPGE